MAELISISTPQLLYRRLDAPHPNDVVLMKQVRRLPTSELYSFSTMRHLLPDVR